MKTNFKVLVLWGGLITFFLVIFFTQGSSSRKSFFNKIQPLVLSSPIAKTRIATLGILADIHSSWNELEKAVQQLNQEKTDTVLVLGDLTDLGSLEDLAKAKEILDKTMDGRPTGRPYIIILGNHDVWYSRREGNLHDFNFLKVFGEQPTCLSLKGLNLVLLDNSEENKQIPQADWQKIEQCINKTQPLFFFSHEPLYHPANDLVMGKYSPGVATQAAMLRQDLCGKKAKLVVGAHLHSFSKYFYACDNGYQLPMLVAPAVTQERNFQSPRFLLLDIFADGSFEEREVILE